MVFERAVTGFDQDADRVTLKISSPTRHRELRANFVVGCDGGASVIREIIGSKLLGSTYTERWLVIDAIVKNHDVRQITFGCDPRRPRVELPAVGERVRWEFMQLSGETEEILKNDDKIRSLVTETTKYRCFDVERKAVYTFHARVADRWRQGRVFLAGDAAHLMPPFAGQGMNGGMKDAVNLAWKIAAVLKGQASEAILDSYQVERAPVVRRMVEVSRRLGSVIMPTGRVAAAARDTVFAFLNLFSGFRSFIGRGGFVPPPEIKRSTLTGAESDAVIGQMVPQPTVSSPQGSAMLDDYLSCHQWLALGVGVDPVSLLSERDLAILDALGARFICINTGKSDARTLSLGSDDSSFVDWTRRYQVGGLLVRPDRFIAQRLDSGCDLSALTPFAATRRVDLARAAA